MPRTETYHMGHYLVRIMQIIFSSLFRIIGMLPFSHDKWKLKHLQMIELVMGWASIALFASTHIDMT